MKDLFEGIDVTPERKIELLQQLLTRFGKMKGAAAPVSARPSLDYDEESASTPPDLGTAEDEPQAVAVDQFGVSAETVEADGAEGYEIEPQPEFPAQQPSAQPPGELITDNLSDEDAFAAFAAAEGEDVERVKEAVAQRPVSEPAPEPPVQQEPPPASGDLITNEMSDEEAFAAFAAAEKEPAAPEVSQPEPLGIAQPAESSPAVSISDFGVEDAGAEEVAPVVSSPGLAAGDFDDVVVEPSDEEPVMEEVGIAPAPSPAAPAGAGADLFGAPAQADAGPGLPSGDLFGAPAEQPQSADVSLSPPGGLFESFAQKEPEPQTIGQLFESAFGPVVVKAEPQTVGDLFALLDA